MQPILLRSKRRETTFKMEELKWLQRSLSDMAEMYHDQSAVNLILMDSDPIIYEFTQSPVPETEGDIAYGISRVYPGKIGNEYYMTKGHFHSIEDTAEVYFTRKGMGLMLIENKAGEWDALPLEAGKATYVPKGFAHRSINIGKELLEMLFAFRADAGHDYATIEIKGFRNIVIEEEKTKIIPNSNWSE